MKDYVPSKEVLSLPDYEPFEDLKERIRNRELNNLLKMNLKESKRVCFYSTGFAEGLLLDYIQTDWRDIYLSKKFCLEHYSDQFK